MLKRIEILLILTVLLLSTSCISSASGLDLSGSLQSFLDYNLKSGELGYDDLLTITGENDFGFTSDFYLDLTMIKNDKNEDIELKLSQAYLDYYTENMDWRVGKQEINWGSSYKINPTSYFDSQQLMQLDPVSITEGVRAVRGTYYGPGDIELIGVVAPFASGSNDLDDIEYAVKATRRQFHGWDLSLSGFKGRDEVTVPGGNIMKPEVTAVGFDMIGSINVVGVWTEVVYKNFNDALFNNNLEGVIGAEYRFYNNLSLTGQYYYKQGRIAQEPDFKALNLRITYPVRTFHELEFTGIYELDKDIVILRPQFNYSLAEAVELQVGASIVNDNGEDYYGVPVQDTFYTGLNIHF
ncbi:MAG: hypothetical protein PWR10_2096 [Halanaerobiales bacterium]|nr:hypothetical protein [Halanaerobiales bacterium]